MKIFKIIISLCLIVLLGSLVWVEYPSDKLVLKPITSKLITVPFEIGSGTGYFVNQDTIVTDAHVAEDNTILTAINYSTNETSTLTVIAKDELTDLAILRIDSPMSKIVPLCISSKDVFIGQSVASAGYGNPQFTGSNKDFHNGHISGFIQFLPIVGSQVLNYMAIDMVTVFGDSGSPVIESHGCVIGNVDILPNYSIFPIWGTDGVTPNHRLFEFLASNHIKFESSIFTFKSDMQRLNNATIQIIISHAPIPSPFLDNLFNGD